MTGENSPAGINMASLQEAFSGSEDVLVQMLALFQVQAVERMAQLDGHLAAQDEMGARTALHSLVNISGAVRAYGMSDLAKAVGDAVKRQDGPQAQALAAALRRECEWVLLQVGGMLAAAASAPQDIWTAVPPAAPA